MEHSDGNSVSLLIAAAITIVVFYFRFRSAAKSRTLKVNQLWIVPALYSLITVAFILYNPPHGQTWVLIAAALALGIALGWLRGTLMQISIDATSQQLNQKASPAAVLLIGGLVVARLGWRLWAAHGSMELATSQNVMAGTTPAIILSFVAGLLSAQRTEMFIRARRLLTRQAD